MARRMFYTFWNVFSNIHLWFVSFSAHLDEHSLRANCGIFFKPRFFWLDRLVSIQKNSPYRSMKKGDGWKQNFSFLLRINLEICLIFAIHLLEDMDTLCAFEKILFLLPQIACSVYALPTHTHTQEYKDMAYPHTCSLVWVQELCHQLSPFWLSS